jgi:sec-independent protein translocase protein TatA
MPNLSVTELLIIAFILVLLFGSRKLPDAARGIGRSLRIFKAETKGLRDDDRAREQRLDDDRPTSAPRPIESRPADPPPVPGRSEDSTPVPPTPVPPGDDERR